MSAISEQVCPHGMVMHRGAFCAFCNDATSAITCHLCPDPECGRCIPCGYCKCRAGMIAWSTALMLVSLGEWAQERARLSRIDDLENEVLRGAEVMASPATMLAFDTATRRVRVAVAELAHMARGGSQ